MRFKDNNRVSKLIFFPSDVAKLTITQKASIEKSREKSKNSKIEIFVEIRNGIEMPPEIRK